MRQDLIENLITTSLIINGEEKEVYLVHYTKPEVVIIYDKSTDTLYRNTNINNITTNELLGMSTNPEECISYKNVICYSDKAFINAENDDLAEERVVSWRNKSNFIKLIVKAFINKLEIEVDISNCIMVQIEIVNSNEKTYSVAYDTVRKIVLAPITYVDPSDIVFDDTRIINIYVLDDVYCIDLEEFVDGIVGAVIVIDELKSKINESIEMIDPITFKEEYLNSSVLKIKAKTK